MTRRLPWWLVVLRVVWFYLAVVVVVEALVFMVTGGIDPGSTTVTWAVLVGAVFVTCRAYPAADRRRHEVVR